MPSRQRLVALLKLFENALLQGNWDADAGVGDGQPHHRTRGGVADQFRADNHRPLIGELLGI